MVLAQVGITGCAGVGDLPGLTRRDSQFRHRWRCTFPTIPLNSQLNPHKSYRAGGLSESPPRLHENAICDCRFHVDFTGAFSP